MKRILFCLFLLMSFSTIYAANYNYTVDCITDSNGGIVKYDDPISSSTVYKITQKVFKNIDENSNTTFCIGKLVKKESAIVPLDTSTSYIGYYADVDDDGTVDGVIFADLAFRKSGTWGTNSSYGKYSYSAQTKLKDYYISQESYTDKFGIKPVISPVSGATGNDRFYVMALSDIGDTVNYQAAYNKNGISNWNTITSNDFGSGKQNTTNMIIAWNNKTYGEQNTGSTKDIWGLIQDQVNNGWFVPSRAEWAAIGSAFSITKSNYFSSFNFPPNYWTSSLSASKDNFVMALVSNQITTYYIGNGVFSLRLATTF